MTTHSQLPIDRILYKDDFYRWIQTTTRLLKERRFEAVDWENLIEEIESMGKSEKKELKNRLITLIEHLLKLTYWEAERVDNTRGWRCTIVEQRRQILLSLEDSPSLRPLLGEIFLDSYQIAKEDTQKKYHLPLDMFPNNPPFTLESAINPDYFPS